MSEYKKMRKGRDVNDKKVSNRDNWNSWDSSILSIWMNLRRKCLPPPSYLYQFHCPRKRADRANNKTNSIQPLLTSWRSFPHFLRVCVCMCAIVMDELTFLRSTLSTLVFETKIWHCAHISGNTIQWHNGSPLSHRIECEQQEKKKLTECKQCIDWSIWESSRTPNRKKWKMPIETGKVSGY